MSVVDPEIQEYFTQLSLQHSKGILGDAQYAAAINVSGVILMASQAKRQADALERLLEVAGHIYETLTSLTIPDSKEINNRIAVAVKDAFDLVNRRG